MRAHLHILFFILLAQLPFYAVSQEEISLAGEWKFQADPLGKGTAERWFSKDLADNVKLPGSMAGNLKGDDVSLTTKWTGSIYDSSFYFNPRLAKYRQPGNIHIPFWLTPAKHFVGIAWYQKEVQIPSGWKGKRIVLSLERCHIETTVWVDDQEAGMQNSLVAAHEYDLTPFLTAGSHRITVRIDNSLKDINVGPDSHSITDHTQGNWNGIIGKMALQAGAKVFLEDVQVFPDPANRKARVKMTIANTEGRVKKGSITLRAKSFNSEAVDETKPVTVPFVVTKQGTLSLEADLPFDGGMLTWDEFHPVLYRLTASVNSGRERSVHIVQFGMREFKIQGNQFLINGRPVFLRGTVNNCEFPLTGYPPTDTLAWERIFRIAKSFGLNHMRFHSWCPPEAAFIAADKAGFYLQPEGPSWPNHGPKIGLGQPVDQYLYDETNRMAKNYGNYASFTMLSAGNEPAGNQVKYLTEFVEYWKKKDARRVYTGMSVGGSWPVIPNAEYQVRGGIRGLNWDRQPESESDYSAGIARFSVPFVAHEMGQWCAYPDFDEIKNYTGIYRAKNFEMFRHDLNDRGMGDQARDFLRASGRLQALCYKNEIEKALRTPGYAGFQLLGLQDFPGQGTALVGVLNAFWDEKGYIRAKEFSRFCNTTVPLARLPKFVFGNDESFSAAVCISHSGEHPLSDAVTEWVIKKTDGSVLFSGSFASREISFGNGIPVGKIEIPLSEIKEPVALTLEVKLKGTQFANDWNFWVFPTAIPSVGRDIYYTTNLDEKARQILNRGGKVFLNAAGKVVKGKEVAMHFLPVFWNTSWFKMRPPHVTGMLIQDKSPAFGTFPTASYSDLQWWDIANRSQVMILEDFPAGFRPLVQPIDTWFLNRRLGLIFEAKVGKGSLIVSSADLSENPSGRPAARQLFASLMKYMASPAFSPSAQVGFETIKDIFIRPSREVYNTYTKDSPDELKPVQGNKK